MIRLAYNNTDTHQRELRNINVEDFNMAINIAEGWCRENGYGLLAVWDVEKLNKENQKSKTRKEITRN